jgi:hypothetical protein
MQYNANNKEYKYEHNNRERERERERERFKLYDLSWFGFPDLRLLLKHTT